MSTEGRLANRKPAFAPVLAVATNDSEVSAEIGENGQVQTNVCDREEIMTEQAKPADVAVRPSEAAEHYALPTPREVEDEIAERRPIVTGHVRVGVS
jgi:hypothetical protein